MRCEICGAPLQEGETRCSRCSSRGSSSNALESPRTRDTDTIVPIPESIPPTPGPQSPGVPEPLEHRASLPLPRGESPAPMPTSFVLEGKYRLVNEIGRGSMGTVFLAEDVTLRRRVAVKFLLPELVNSEDCASRFRAEAIAMASIRDNNVAQIYAYGNEGGSPYFVMEYLDGETVEFLIDSHNRRGYYVPLSDAVDILVQATSGLSSIHRASAVHRDIKPANIMLTHEPVRAVIMDFGLVRDVQMEDDLRTLAGTPAYIAPELVEGRSGADRSTLADIYSLGTTAYELLTGSIPFGGETWVEILQRHITEVPAFPSVRRPGLPEKLDDVVMRAMSKEPRERYQSCEDLLDDLLEVQQMPLPTERTASIAPPAADGYRSSSRTGRGSSGSGSRQRAFRSTPTGSRARLLVADADQEFRALVHGTAKAAVPGCRVHSATDGEMALDMLRTMRPHAVLVDLSLPRVNGLEIAAAIRGEAGGDNIDVIVVTESGGSREAEILKALGVRSFLTKPVDPEDLADVLRPILERPLSVSRSAPPPPIG